MLSKFVDEAVTLNSNLISYWKNVHVQWLKDGHLPIYNMMMMTMVMMFMILSMGVRLRP
jgi:hypothetical protein